MGLRQKLFAPLLVFLLIFIAYVQWYWLPRLGESIVKQHRLHAKNHLQSVAESLVPLLLQEQLANIHDTLDSLLKSNANWKQLQLRDRRNRILYPLEARPLAKPGPQGLRIHQPIEILDKKIGTLDLVVDFSADMAEVSALERNFFIVLLVLLVIVVLAIAVLLELVVSGPVRLMADVSKDLAKGNYTVSLPKARSDEIGYLVKSFDTMRRALARYKMRVEQEIHGHKRTTRELYAQKERLAYYATHDSLTGLYNRREFEVRLSAAIDRAHKERIEHAVFFIDLDRFKIVNDSCGHLAGDELLKQVGVLIRKHIREVDTLARLGGDEYAVLLEFCPENVATGIVSELHQSIQEFMFSWKDQVFSIGASIGVTFINARTADVESVLASADKACYQAKESGRNRFYIHKPLSGAQPATQSGSESVAGIIHALDNEGFVLYAQPYAEVNRHNSDCRHIEILIRMRAEDGELIMPGRFIPLAERYKLMTKIDYWVIDKAFSVLQQFGRESTQQVVFSINLSGVSMSDSGLYAYISEKLSCYAIDATSICFEVTETAAVSDVLNAKMAIKKLKELGCRFALDDFGSGFCSFAYLKHLPMDYLKIDGAFVRDITEDPIDAAMVRAIHEIGKVLGMQTIAEFVENREILRCVQQIGVDFVQGFGIARPVPLQQLLQDIVSGNGDSPEVHAL